MHLLAREVRTIDDEQGAVDLGHTPADVVLLSFSDSDLGAAAAAWPATIVSMVLPAAVTLTRSHPDAA